MNETNFDDNYNLVYSDTILLIFNFYDNYNLVYIVTQSTKFSTILIFYVLSGATFVPLFFLVVFVVGFHKM